jgi:hypothetical protein
MLGECELLQCVQGCIGYLFTIGGSCDVSEIWQPAAIKKCYLPTKLMQKFLLFVMDLRFSQQ